MAGLAGHAARRLLASQGFRVLLARLGPTAAAKAVDLARQGQWRRLAILHADSIVDGLISRAVLDGTVHWVVWRGDVAVAAYPPYDGDLAAATRDLDPAARVRPADLATRQALQGAGSAARDTGRRVGTGLSQARRAAREGVRRASGEGARRAGRSLGKRRRGFSPGDRRDAGGA